MHRIVISIALLLSSVSLFAESEDSNSALFDYSSPSLNHPFNASMRADAMNRVTASFDYFSNSNSLPASFLYKFLFRGYISPELKATANRRMRSEFNFEDYLNTGVDYRRRLKKWDGEVYVGYRHRQMRNLSGVKETFQLAFYGNARFNNDTADLSRLHFQNFIYHQYSVGIKKNFRNKQHLTQLGVGVSFLQVISNQQIRTGNNTWLYTARDGEFLDMKYDLTYNNAKEGATPFTSMNGAGFSTDLHLSYTNSNRWRIAMDISDLGMMAFARSPVNYTDTGFARFRGIEIPNLLSFSSSTFDTLNVDSAILSNLPAKTNNNYSVFMPFTMTMVYSQSVFTEKFVIHIGAQYRHLPKYFLYGYVKLNYFIRPDIVASVSGGAGGYSRFNLGVEFSKRWKHVDFSLGSGNLIGLIAPAKYSGTGMYLRLGTSF